MEEADESWKLVLVNAWHPLENASVALDVVESRYRVDARIADALCAMLTDARAEGLSPLICSAYRTHEKQQSLYENRVRRFLVAGESPESARVKAAQWVAVPGTSEHQTGLAVDIVAASNQNLDESQERTKEQRWLMQHAHEYGFILRYPSGKTAYTGIQYEPWHYRYVGREAAQVIYEQGICLEEYLGWEPAR